MNRQIAARANELCCQGSNRFIYISKRISLSSQSRGAELVFSNGSGTKEEVGKKKKGMKTESKQEEISRKQNEAGESAVTL